MDNTFENLSLLKKVQVDVKLQLGNKYVETVTPYIQIIEMTMKANDINEFSALKMIKDNLAIYKKSDAPMLFSSALIEITEAKHFQELKN